MEVRREFLPYLGRWFVFKSALRLPRHRWFYYKEGFSPELVRWFLSLTRAKSIYDPFMGVGTVPLEASLRGVEAGGNEVFDFAYFVASVKLKNWETLENFGEGPPEEWRFSLFPPQRAFPRKTYEELLRKRSWAKSSPPHLLALASVLYPASNLEKDGGVLRLGRKTPRPVGPLLRAKLRQMREDLRVKVPEMWEISNQDARSKRVKAEAILTSPPYFNGVDYRKVYGLEASFVFGERPRRGFLRSYEGRQHLDLYLKDLRKCLSEWDFEHLGVVIANVPTPRGEIKVDEKLAQWLTDEGFWVRILVGRKLLANYSFSLVRFSESLVLASKEPLKVPKGPL